MKSVLEFLIVQLKFFFFIITLFFFIVSWYEFFVLLVPRTYTKMSCSSFCSCLEINCIARTKLYVIFVCIIKLVFIITELFIAIIINYLTSLFILINFFFCKHESLADPNFFIVVCFFQLCFEQISCCSAFYFLKHIFVLIHAKIIWIQSKIT